MEKFIQNSNNNYEVDYYYPKNKITNVWKLKIKGQENTPYYGKILSFKIDFNKGFKKLSDIIKLENNIYHLNFGDNGMLLFDIKYNEKKSFYENLKELFDLLCKLFVEPDCGLSTNTFTFNC